MLVTQKENFRDHEWHWLVVPGFAWLHSDFALLPYVEEGLFLTCHLKVKASRVQRMSTCESGRRLQTDELLDISNEWFILSAHSSQQLSTVYQHLTRSRYSFMDCWEECTWPLWTTGGLKSMRELQLRLFKTQLTTPSSGLYGIMRLTTPAEPNRQRSFNEQVLQPIFDYRERYNKSGQEVQTTVKTRYLVFN